MKITALRTVALAGAAITLLSLSTTQASAYVGVSVRVGTPPPAARVDRYQRWPQPSRNAIWIGGHNEWNGRGWVWVGGYYGYPPRRGAVWVDARYHHGYYYPRLLALIAASYLFSTTSQPSCWTKVNVTSLLK